MEIALAFPDVPRYRELIGRIKYAIERLHLRVFFAQESGEVQELACSTSF